MHRYTSSSIRSRGSEHPLLEVPSDKSKAIDAIHILKHPYRATRPDHLVVILRGLPGASFFPRAISFSYVVVRLLLVDIHFE